VINRDRATDYSAYSIQYMMFSGGFFGKYIITRVRQSDGNSYPLNVAKLNEFRISCIGNN